MFCTSCGIKLYSGLKLQSTSLFSASKPNVTAEFYGRVHKSLQLRYPNQKPARAQIHMMPIGTPRVPYRTPGEGTWQWVDLWNALYRERVIFIGQNIDEEFSNQILATMLYLDSIDNAKKLYMYINGPGGDADDIQNEANELLRIRDYLFKELANKTGQPVEKITQDLSRMKRFNAQEALEYGLIDRVVRPPRIKADAPCKDAGTGLG
ncbi:hypothetical protein TanjilG_21763 [Lupinus angustifolius]|uniref:ATP-dependent Clp protease proteolytic subunit n=1 Tax=Lupinus angustifolius TaxID=3871 RepID=A0A1J7FZQ4_LUPAN|nr:hypothetical protein TanjilG_21763 [Lupinus angustifolius]